MMAVLEIGYTKIEMIRYLLDCTVYHNLHVSFSLINSFNNLLTKKHACWEWNHTLSELLLTCIAMCVHVFHSQHSPDPQPTFY